MDTMNAKTTYKQKYQQSKAGVTTAETLVYTADPAVTTSTTTITTTAVISDIKGHKAYPETKP